MGSSSAKRSYALTDPTVHLEHTAGPMITSRAHILARILSLVLLLLTPPLYAQGTEPDDLTEEVRERVRAQMEETEERLQLTDEQRDAVRPILEDSYMQRQAILEKYGIDLESTNRSDRPGRRTLRQIRNDLNRENEETTRKLEAVLTGDQMDRWKTLQEERRAEMRDRIRNNP